MAIILHHTGQVHIWEHAPKNPPRTLAALIWQEDWQKGPQASDHTRALCMGIGHCGLCRVLFRSPPPALTHEEEHALSPEEQRQGIRLACRHLAADGMELELPQAKLVTSEPDCKLFDDPDALEQNDANSIPNNILVAVDLGTSSLAWQARSVQDASPSDHILEQGQALNPQFAGGSDIMSRLALAAQPAGADQMRLLIRHFLRDLSKDLARRHGRILAMGLAANPAMAALALGRDTSGLRNAPYTLDYPGGCWEHVEELPPLWVAPHISPFVGGDISAGLVTLLDRPRPFLLADMGTNGEFLLLTKDRLLVTSVPLGPALEGVGMRCGALAGPGVASAFHPSPTGLRGITPDGSPPARISGTGYLSLAHLLLDMGILTPEGVFARHGKALQPGLEGLRTKVLASLREGPRGEARLPVEENLFLDASDVENLLKVKAAFELALLALLQYAGMNSADLDKLYLAGALGKHAPLPSLTRLGFLPPGLEEKTEAIGNAALAGMALLLPQLTAFPLDANPSSPQRKSTSLFFRLEQVLRNAQSLDLTSYPLFYQRYVAHMSFQPVQDPA